jgi:predicted DNA-binding ribbon-helix-helix protein
MHVQCAALIDNADEKIIHGINSASFILMECFTYNNKENTEFLEVLFFQLGVFAMEYSSLNL